MSSSLKYINQHRLDEHDLDEPRSKKVSIYGWDSDNLQKRRISVDDSGVLKIVLMAEDVDNPGTYATVQGQYNADGNFELLTAGSSSSTPTSGIGYMTVGSTFTIT